jgi:diguanylate cyclase (GGDEF)-like protein/PAS domain S-box-containing protein
MDGLVAVVTHPAFVIASSALLLLMSIIGLLALRDASRLRRVVRVARARESDVSRQAEGVMEALKEGVIVTAQTGEILLLSESAAAILGLARADLLGRPIGRLPIRAIDALMHPVNLQEVFSARYGDGDLARIIGVPGRRGSDDIRWIQVKAREISDAHGGQPIQVATIVDSVDAREAREVSSRADSQYRRVVENAPMGIALVDLEWRLMEVNRAFAAMLGSTVGALRGTPIKAISHREDATKESPLIQDLYDGTLSRFSIEKRFVKSDGSTVWGVLEASLVRHAGGAPDHYVVHVRETNEERIRQEHLEHRAERDPLTQLANRGLFYDSLRSALASATGPNRVAVIVVDLDGFKGLNDRYGHQMGDTALRHVATILRQVTGMKGVVARLGGDEFAIVVSDADAGRTAFDIAAAVHERLRPPLEVKRHRIAVRVSIGIAIGEPGGGPEGDVELVDAADTAMYRAKGAGKSRTELYVPSMKTSDSSHGILASELKKAVEAGDLVLHYQPVLDLEARAVVGYEALVRWQHPTRGLLLPGTFLPLLDDKTLSVELGGLLVDQVASFLALERDSPIWVSLNISADQLGDSEFADRVLRSIARHHLSPQRIVIELTEASLVAPNTRIRHELTELRNAGVPILLDDFGTGVSPLSYLRDLPVSGVKLDMSFTSGIPEDPAGARVSRALGALARELGLATIAEGIETESQARFLHACGWKYGQGWLFGVAQPVHATRELGLPIAEGYIDPRPQEDDEP